MARSYRPVVRDQQFLLPPNMADWLPEDHLVWFILDVVDQLDTTGFHATRRTGGAGRAGYDPDMLVALLLYAYAVGERSSRRIEQLCGDHVAFRVVCAQDVPDHTTIARFRAEHNEAFVEVFTQVLRLCSAAGMGKVGSIAIDGTKIAANASRSSNCTPKSVRDEARRLAEQVTAEAAKVDEREDAAAKAKDRDDGQLPPKFTRRGGRAENVKKALAELERQDTEQAQADAADHSRGEELLVQIATGEHMPPGPVPAGIDPVAYHRARIQGHQKRIADLTGIKGPGASRKRRTARESLKRAQEALQVALQAAGAGQDVDLRGLAARARDRRNARSRARGGRGDQIDLTDPDSRLMTEGSGGGSVQGYNAQLAVTDDHLILGLHLSQDANDTSCYLPTLGRSHPQQCLLRCADRVGVGRLGLLHRREPHRPRARTVDRPGQTPRPDA